VTSGREETPILPLVRTAVICAIVGLGCLSVFLWRGFSPWSVGVAIGAGVPLMTVAVALYLLAVIRELRRRGEL
jgi:hypothetical protein